MKVWNDQEVKQVFNTKLSTTETENRVKTLGNGGTASSGSWTDMRVMMMKTAALLCCLRDWIRLKNRLNAVCKVRGRAHTWCRPRCPRRPSGPRHGWRRTGPGLSAALTGPPAGTPRCAGCLRCVARSLCWWRAWCRRARRWCCSWNAPCPESERLPVSDTSPGPGGNQQHPDH